MSDSRSVFDKQFAVDLSAAPKASEVAAAVESKRASMAALPPAAMDLYNLAARRRTGNGAASASQAENDAATLSPLAYSLKYGDEAQSNLALGSTEAEQEYKRDRTLDRSTASMVGDTINSVLTGGVGTIAGIGALGTGLVSPSAGVKVSQAIQKATGQMEMVKSDAMAGRRRANAADNAMSNRDNAAAYEADKKTDSPFYAGLKNFGREALSTAANLDDPMLVGDVVANGVGSLLAVGPLSKGLGAIGKATLGRAGASGALARATAEKAGGRFLSAGERIALAAEGNVAPAAAVGLMEGGGAYQQTTAEAYERLKDRTDLTEEQKVIMANDAGKTAAAIQGPVGAITGAITGAAKFEASPFRAPTVGSAAHALLSETVEEAAQSASGQMAQNYAIQRGVDPNQDLTEGVGEQFVLGAVGGLGAAGAVQAPGLAVSSAIRTAKLPFVAAKAGVNYVGSITEARNKRVQDQVLNGIYDGVEGAAPEARTVVSNLAGMAEDVRAKAMETIDKVANHPRMQEAAATVRSAAADLPARLMAMGGLSSMVAASQAEQESSTPAGLGGTAFQSVKDFVANASQSDGVQKAMETGKKLFDQYAPAVNAAMQTAISTAVTAAKGLGPNEAPAQFEDVQTNVPVIAAMIETTPDKVDPKVVDDVLYHDEQGNIALTPVQRTAFRTAQVSARATQKGAELGTKYGMADAEEVSRQVLTAEPKESDKLSMTGHMQGIKSAFNAGNVEEATQRLSAMRNFAQHLNNQIGGFNQALADNAVNDTATTSFQSHIGGGKFRPRKIYLAKTAKSIKLAQTVAIQAQVMTDAANSLAEALGLQMSPVERIALDSVLDGDARTVAQTFARPKPVPVVDTPVNTNDVVVSEPAVDDTQTAVEEPTPTPEEEPVAEPTPDPVADDKPPVAEAPVEPEAAVVSEPTPVQEADPVEELVEATPEEVAPSSEALPDEPVVEKQTSEAPVVVRVGGENNRLAVFQAPKTSKTYLDESVAPLQTVKDTLTSEATLKAVIGDKLNRRYTQPVAGAYKELLALGDQILGSMDDRLQTFMNKKGVKGRDLSEAPGWTNGGALNLVIQNEDGSFMYDPKLAQTAVLAGLQWYLKMNNHGAQLTDKDVRELFNLNENAPIPNGLGEALGYGLSSVEVARSLAQEIGRFWGMDARNDLPSNQTEAVLEGVAKEMIQAMSSKYDNNGEKIEQGLIDIKQVDISAISTKEGIETVNRYTPGTIEDADGIKTKILSADNPVREFPTAIEKAVLRESEELSYIGEIPTTIAEFQLRSRTPTTDEQKAVIAAEQATEHRLNMPFVSMLTDRLGEDLVLRLFGGGEIVDSLNVNHKRSMEGQNLTVQSAYRTLQNLVAEVSNKADMDGRPVDDMPVHYAYAYTVVNRLQMLGKDNPQSNKLMREAILPTWDVLDMTDPDNRMKFSLGLAQALGVKVHTLGSKAMLTKLQEALGKFPKTMELLADPKEGGYTADDVDVMKSEGVKSVVSLHALMEYVRLQNTPAEDRKAFRTALYFEADGVTNGVINAMSLFTSGQFTPNWIQNIERGGLWIGEKVMSLADLRGRSEEGSDVDLYGVSATGTVENVKALRKEYANSDVNTIIGAALDLLNMFHSGVEYDSEKQTMKIDRGATKNPLTITIYGSGASGIAGNILDEVLTEVYQQFSDAGARQAADKGLTLAEAMFPGDKASATERFNKMAATFKTLSQNKLMINRKAGDGSLFVGSGIQGNALTGSDFTSFTLSSEARKVMEENLLNAFVNPMVQSITDTVGADLVQTMALIKTQTQSWSLVGQFMYQNAYEQALKAKRAADPRMGTYDLLSRAENEAVIKSVQADLPAFSTGTQNFTFGGKQKLDLPFMVSKSGKQVPLEFSKDLNGNMETPAYGYMPGDSGVSGQPIMTIGSGDGQAVQNIIQDPATPKNRLQIYDGIHSTVRELDQMSLVANKGVYDSWQRNPLMNLAQAFESFANQVDLTSLSEDQRKVLAKSALNDWEGIPTSEDIGNALSMIAAEGMRRADGVTRRQAVLARVQLSVDQMAGASKPFTKTGVILSGSASEKAAQLNILMAQPASVVEAVADIAQMKAVAAELALFNKLTDRQIVKMTQDKTTRALLREVIRSGAVADYGIHTGTREELLQRAADMGIAVPAERQGTFQGFMDPASKQLFVINGNAETMLHELIHAATYETVQAHYDGTSTPETAAAIGRIEILMAEFKSADLEGISYQNALDEMERQAANGNQAAELNEFMAWALSNPDIANQLKTTKVIDKMARLAKAAVRELKALIFGGKRSAAVKDDVLSNLRFNTSIVMRSRNSAVQMLGEGMLFHDAGFGNNTRVTNLLSKVKAKVTDFATEDRVTRAVNLANSRKSLVNGARIQKAFFEAGFDMTMQEKVAFAHMVSIMGTAAELDSNSTARMQDMYSAMIKGLSVDSFLRDRTQNDPADNEQANRKFALLAGKFADRADGMDRSSILPAFIALAQTNDEFRQILNGIQMPKNKYAGWNTVDGAFDNLGEMAMEFVGKAVSGEGVTNRNMTVALDGMVAQMLETNAESQLYIEKFTNPVGNFIDKGNAKLVEGFAKLGEYAQSNLAKKQAKSATGLQTKMAESFVTLTGLLHEPTGHESAIRMMSAANRSDKLPQFFYDLLNDLTGRTAENAPVYDLIKIARQWISGIRQQYVEEMPKIIEGKFTRVLTDIEKTAMHKGLAQTDMASLLSSNSIDDIVEVLRSPSKRDQKIKSLKDKIGNISPANAKLIIAKSEQLADFIVNRKTGTGLLRNADAIANLLSDSVKETVTSPEMIEAIDHLVSLQAYGMQGALTHDPIFSLVHSEVEGLDFVLNSLRGQRDIDRAKAVGNARFNHYKGYMAASNADGVNIIVADDKATVGPTQVSELLAMGYVRLGPVRASERDPSGAARSYWYSPVSGRSGFSQGIFQNVQQTVSGVDAQTGYSNALTAGAISDPKFVQQLARSNKAETYGQALLPIYGETGQLIGYERQVDPAMADKLKPDYDLPAMMGVRSGRQMEEAAAFGLNKTLVDRLRDIYDQQKNGRSDEFVDLFKSKDPVHQDAVSIMSRETKAYIESRFPKGFMVRKDMINDSVGYRTASIGDAFTGTSRWSPETQEFVKKGLQTMFGNKAYTYSVRAEKFIQNTLVQDVRTLIVIKSVVVPVANALSNVYQLISRGVPSVQIFRSIPKKTAEIEAWHKTRLRQMEAEAELLAVTDTMTRNRLEAEIQTIKDSHKRLSIYPLLEAGEFSSISDAGSREDVLLTEGKLSEYLERMVDKLPAGVKTAGKYAIVSKDTALFRGLQKTIDYGDFIAKSVLYDDLTKRQGKSKADALAQITEEFVNYDRLPGRDRQYLESIGLLWFWNFKVRSAKVAMSMIRNNPLHGLISANLPMPLGVGLPIQDNLWASIMDGRAFNSLGAGMAFRAPGLLPIGNLFG